MFLYFIKNIVIHILMIIFQDLVSHYEKLGHNFVLFNFRNSLKPTLIHADAKQMDLVFADQMSDLTPLISKN